MPIEVPGEGALIPTEVARHVRQGHPGCPPFCQEPLGKGHGSWRGVVAKERQYRPELGWHRFGPALLPVDQGIYRHSHPFGCLPLEETELPAALLQVLAQGLGCIGIILWLLSLKR